MANNLPGPDTIALEGGTYDIWMADEWYEDQSVTGDLDVTDDLAIRGAGQSTSILTGHGERMMDVATDVAATLSDLSIRDIPGYFAPLDCGKGIRSRGDLTLDRVTIANNQMRGSGGGICNDGGTLTIRGGVISGNCACFFGFGGGIYSTGTVLIERVTVSGNWADARDGGGVFSGVLNTAVLTIRDSAITDNKTTAPFGERRGGGVAAGGTAILANVTISGNRTDAAGTGDIDSRGGGLALYGDITLTNVTITNNETDTTAGGLYYNGSGTLTMTNTIIAGNTGGDCEGPITSAGHNISGDGSCTLTGPGDLIGVDPMLAPLADNGGPTQTQALLPRSPPIDAGDDAACPETDQRGAPRPVDGDGSGGAACDIGAYEAGGAVPTPPPPTPTATPPPPVLTGDTDCNGTVNAVDAMWALRFTAAMTPFAECLFAANANCDLQVNAVDALLILRYVAALPVTQPPSCPKIGPP